jgi:hypothetical protein
MSGHLNLLTAILLISTERSEILYGAGNVKDYNQKGYR